MIDIVPRLVIDEVPHSPSCGHHVLEWVCPGCHAVLKRVDLDAVLVDPDEDNRRHALDQPAHHVHTDADRQPVPIPVQQAAAALLAYEISDDGRRPAPPEHHSFNRARALADMGLLLRLPYAPAEHFQVVREGDYETHAEHCCTRHGCKYYYKYGTNCPVTQGKIQARYECEACEHTDDDTDLYEP